MIQLAKQAIHSSVLLLTAAAALADEPRPLPHARWARFETAPVIDGRLDDACWKTAERHAFSLIEDGSAPKEATDARFGHDGAQLYFGFRMQQAGVTTPNLPLGPQIEATVTERDGRLQRDDAVEIHLNPVDRPEASAFYYRFAANALGTQADSYEGDITWDAHWTVAVAHGMGYWSMEIAVPFAALSASVGRTTPVWRLNLSRGNQGLKEYSAWSPTFSRRFNVPSRFGMVEAPAVDLGRYAYFAVPHLSFHEYDAEHATLEARFTIQNNSDQARTAAVALAVTSEVGPAPGAPAEQIVSVPARGLVNASAPVSLAGGGRLRADLFVRDPETRETLAYAQPVRFHAPDTLSGIFELTYYTDEPEAVVRLRANVGAEALAGVETHLVLGDAPAVAWQATRPAQPLAKITVPIAGLPAGTHALRMELRRGERVLGRSSATLVKREPAANAVKFNTSRHGAVVDGRLFFPYGITHVPRLALAEIAALGFNCAVIEQTHPERASGWDDGAKMAEWRAYLDTAQELGLKVIPGLFHAGTGFKEQYAELYPKYMAGLPPLVEHPALLAWYTVGEPNLPDRAAVCGLHDALKKMDPYHPTFAIFCIQIQFSDGWDVGCIDAYWRTGSGRPTHVAMLADGARRITSERRAPFWIVPLAGMASGCYREPTPAEQRCQTYLSLISGATGILYFKYKPAYVPLWEEFGKLAAEIKTLTPALLDSEPAGTVTAQPVQAQDCDIRSLYLEKDGRWYLVAANARNEPVSVRFDLPAPRKPARVRDLFAEARELNLTGNRFEDQFTGYGTHAYVIDEK